MTDPVAEAAANLAKQHSEPGLIEEIKEGMHELAEKVEHLIHPEAVPNVEPVALLEASVAPVDIADAPAEALSSPEAPASAVAPSGEVPNAPPASTSGTLPESTPSAPSESPLPTGSPSTEANLPNAAPAAAEQRIIAASAQDASIPVGIQGVVTSAASIHVFPDDDFVHLHPSTVNVIRTHIAAIKHHLSIRGFEQSAVADIHAELDAIEKWL